MRSGAAALAIALLASTAQAESLAPLRVEYGVPLGGGEFLAPFTALDSTGAALPVRTGQVGIDLGGAPAGTGGAGGGAQVVTFAPAPGGLPSAAALLVNAAGLGPDAAAALATGARQFLDARRADCWRGLFAAGPKLREVMQPASLSLAGGGGGGVRIWDNVGDLLAELALRDLPARRILLVVTDGGGELDNRLTSASCLEAAASTRASVYALYLPAANPAGVGPGGPEGAAARLRRLAEESGGRLVVAAPGEDPGAALRRLLALADGARGARFAAPDLALPATFTLRLAGAELAASGSLRARRLLKERGIGFWPALIVAILALGGGAALVAHFRFASAGELVVSHNGTRLSHRLPRSGTSIGSAAGNTLRIEDRRVSPNHAVLRLRRGGLILTDLRSTHGTQVNGRPVKTAVVVDGDSIVLGGSVEITYRKSRSRR